MGPPTAHTRVPVGRGLSGEAVAENRNLVPGRERRCDACSVGPGVASLPCLNAYAGSISRFLTRNHFDNSSDNIAMLSALRLTSGDVVDD